MAGALEGDIFIGQRAEVSIKITPLPLHNFYILNSVFVITIINTSFGKQKDAEYKNVNK